MSRVGAVLVTSAVPIPSKLLPDKDSNISITRTHGDVSYPKALWRAPVSTVDTAPSSAFSLCHVVIVPECTPPGKTKAEKTRLTKAGGGAGDKRDNGEEFHPGSITTGLGRRLPDMASHVWGTSIGRPRT